MKRGFRLTAKYYRCWLVVPTYLTSIRRKLLKKTLTKERSVQDVQKLKLNKDAWIKKCIVRVACNNLNKGVCGFGWYFKD